MKSIALSESECYEPSIAVNRKTPENIVLVTTPGLTFNSHDNGKTWKAVSLKTEGKQTQNFVLHAGRKGDIKCVYVEREMSGDKFIIKSSEDGGVQWSDGGSLAISTKNVAGPGLNTNPKSGDIMMTWTEFDAYGSDDAKKVSNIMFATSKDGRKWSDPLKINATSGDCLDDNKTPRGATPIATMDGKLFIGWSFDGKIYLDRSFDKGGMWISGDIFVHNQTGGWQLDIPGVESANGLPTLTIDNSPSQFHGSLFYVFADKSKDTDTDVWFLRSHNLGDNWTTALQIAGDSVKSQNQFMPAISVDITTGIIYIAYYSKGNTAEDLADVYLAYSVDNGNSFKYKKLNEESFFLSGNIGEHIALDAYRGNIAVAWTTVSDTKRQVEATVIKQADIITLPQPSGKKKK